MAVHHFDIVDGDAAAEPRLKYMNAALLAAADGDWTASAASVQKVIETDPENISVRMTQIASLGLSTDPQLLRR